MADGIRIKRRMLVRTLNEGEYFADILTNLRDPRQYFIYVVQRNGSADVLAMGCCDSENEAVACASRVIEQLQAARAASA